MEENKPMDWATQQSDAVHRMQKGGGLPGLARAEQIAGRSGREILEAMVSGALPYPPMNDTLNLALREVGMTFHLDPRMPAACRGLAW